VRDDGEEMGFYLPTDVPNTGLFEDTSLDLKSELRCFVAVYSAKQLEEPAHEFLIVGFFRIKVSFRIQALYTMRARDCNDRFHS
jgi:hypothetical protein